MLSRAFLIVVLILAGPALAADEKSNVLKLDSGASISAPEGYTWAKVGEQEKDGRKALMYIAISEKSNARLFLAIDPDRADTDEKRVARIKGFYNGTVRAGKGVTDVKSTPPDLKPPIPDRVQFLMTAKLNGAPMAIAGVMVFGKSTYHFQAGGASEEEALGLAKATESLKE